MPTPRKYYGPCDIHVVYTKRCKHCDGWATHLRRIGQPQQQPRAKRLGTTGKTFTRRIRTWPGRPVLRLKRQLPDRGTPAPS